MPATLSTGHAIPAQLTRFIGRQGELADLVRLLPSARLLTLTGAGGSGKTRLAAELVLPISRGEPVTWIDLASISENDLVIPQVAAGLGIADRGDHPLLELMYGAIATRELLIVLDNCEHLVDVVAGMAESLLMHCPRLTIVATSREALGVPGEVAWLVPPLNQGEAEQLFVERARSVLPTFESGPTHGAAIRDLCTRLDGMPLAIELAAARVRVLSPGQIAQRLEDALGVLSGGGRTTLPRHRTLRGAIDWSYALLTGREQLLLRRLAVFAGPFSLEAAEQVCAIDPISADEVLDGVAALVDKSMVVLDAGRHEARYRLLETIRQYAEELLRESDEFGLLRERHARFAVSLAEAHEHELFGGAADLELVERLTVTSGNLRAAADWCAEQPARTELALRLSYALHWFWFAKGHFAEARRRLETALAVPAEVDRGVRGRALIAAGHIALWQGAVTEVLPRMSEGLSLLQRTDDRFGIAYAHNGVGAGAFLIGENDTAVEHLERAMEISAEFPDHVLNAISRYWRGNVAMEAGELSLARRLFQDAGMIGRRSGHTPAIGHPELMLGRLATRQQQWREALGHFVEGLVVLHGVGDLWGTAQALEGVGITAAGRGDAGATIQFLGAAAALRERIASPHLPQERPQLDAALEWARQEFRSGFHAAWEQARGLDLAETVELARRASPDTGAQLAAVRPVGPAGGTPDLVIRALGPLEVLVDGEPVGDNAWTSARSRELLLYLVCHPRGVSKEQVGAAFWPESSAAQVRNAFHVTMHRLRKALQDPEWVETGNDSYRMSPSVRMLFDVARFEQETTTAIRSASRDEPAAAAALDKALSIYRGDFLEGESATGDWALDERARLQQLHTDGCLALSAIHMLELQHDQAIAVLRRLIQRDRFHEEAWRRLITVHARLGRRTEAIRLYRQLSDLLHDELETLPDRSTVELMDRIQDGRET
ncbi:MAG TPA: BTAD domain-containing putative transcriptional regulator [Gemmatimonadales bacterium]|nr:BTAD domain-containing putative transcriptional regulator [Gemmatimonadales bacterium]